MEFNASSANLLKIKVDSLILPTGSQLKNNAKVIDETLDGTISSLIKAGDFTGKSSEICVLHTLGQSHKRIILLGTDGATTPQKMIKVIEAGARAAQKTTSA